MRVKRGSNVTVRVTGEEFDRSLLFFELMNSYEGI